MLNLLAIPVLLPLGVGLIVGLMAFARNLPPVIPALLSGAVLITVYAVLEGGLTWPATASRQKLGILIIAVAIFAVALSIAPKPALGPAMAVMLLVGFYWIGQRKITSNPVDPDVLIALALIIIVSLILFLQRPSAETAGPWMAISVPFAISAALVSALGGYLSAGQYLGAIAALAGGAVLVGFLTALTRPGLLFSPPLGVIWALLAAATLTLITAILFAPNYNLFALLLTLAIPLTALVIPSMMARPAAARILMCGLIAVLPAVAAGVLAATSSS